MTLKGPNHESFGSEFLTYHRFLWVDNLKTEEKNNFVILDAHAQHTLSDLNRKLSMRLKYNST